jgi:uncharacterized protein (DUF1778 family)
MKNDKREPITQMTLRMSADQRALISEVAARYELSESDVVRHALRAGLKKVDEALSAVGHDA